MMRSCDPIPTIKTEILECSTTYIYAQMTALIECTNFTCVYIYYNHTDQVL